MAQASKVKRRKTKAQRREEQIRIRVTASEKKTLTEAAKRDGLDVSSWLRSAGLKAASS